MRPYFSRKLLLGVVWGLHIIFVLLLLIQPHFSSAKKEHKTLIIKTIIPKTLPTVTARSIEKTQPKLKQELSALPPQKHIATTPKEAPKPIPAAKKTLPKKPTATTPAPKKEPAIADKQLSREKKAPPRKEKPVPRAKISDSLLKELEESIAKMDKAPAVKTSSTKTQKAPSWTLQIDSLESNKSDSDETSYVDLLVSHLHQTLSLPDYGEVKIQLSLHQDGSVIKITVMKAQSKENKRYLEETLPFIRFPRFEGALAQQKESNFVLTFVNEM